MSNVNAPSRVFVTGMGIRCALGNEIDTCWKRMLKGDFVAESIPESWLQFSNFNSRFWAPLPSVDYKAAGLTASDRLRMDPVTMNAVYTTWQALNHAGLTLETTENKQNRFTIKDASAERIGVFMGTGIGGIRTTLQTHTTHALKHPYDQLKDFSKTLTDAEARNTIEKIHSGLIIAPRFNPLAVTMLMANAVSAAPGIRFGAKGPNRTVSLACSSGTAAIGEAFQAIRRGDVDIAICGASEYLYDDYGSIFRSYDITGALTHGFDQAEYCNRPFDQKRNGFLFSEGGAATLILESQQSVHKRGARAQAEVLAFAESFDSYNMMAIHPDGAGITSMLRCALSEANLSPHDVSYVNAHGTSTALNDETELGVLAESGFDKAVVNSTKGLIGHTIGASGAIEAVVSVMSLKHRVTHPCRNLVEPIRPMNFAQSATELEPGPAITNSFAFGGHNCCLVLDAPSQI